MFPQTRAKLFDICPQDVARFLYNYEPAMSMAHSLPEEEFGKQLQSHAFRYGSIKKEWDHRERMDKGDIAIIHLRGGEVLMITIGRRRAIIQEGRKA